MKAALALAPLTRSGSRAALLLPASVIALTTAACSNGKTTVSLVPVAGSGVHGTAELLAKDGGTEASLDPLSSA